jgi:arginine/lysine/histidine transporter system substrate-binding protein
MTQHNAVSICNFYFRSIMKTFIKPLQLLFSVVLIGIITSCGLFSPKTNPEENLIIGSNSGFPPYEMLDSNGSFEGFDIDLGKLLGKKLGKKVIFKDMSFDALILELQQGKIDLAISGISITQKRLNEVALVHYQGAPTTEMTLVFWKAIPAGVTSLEALTQHHNPTICLQSGYMISEVLEKVPGINLKYLPQTVDLVMDIQYGKSVAAVIQPAVAQALNKDHKNLKLLTIEIPAHFQDLGNGIGINKNNHALINKVTAAIAEFKKDGTLATLESKWFKEGK